MNEILILPNDFGINIFCENRGKPQERNNFIHMLATPPATSTLIRFQDFEYQRPDIAALSAEFNQLLDDFEQAGSAEDQMFCFDAINRLRGEFLSMYNISHIRHTINTRDAFYEEENNFFNQEFPSFESLNSKFHEKILTARFREELEAKWGPQLFRIAELNKKTISSAILEDLQEENRLSSEYMKLKARAQIQLNGETYNLSSIHLLETNPDRETRRQASIAKWNFFAENQETIESIYDQLVKKRHQIAVKLGYKNFVQLGYDRLKRSDYNAEKVAIFRDAIAKYMVPLAQELYQRQRKRLQLDQLKYYDIDFRFCSGNPTPKGNTEWIVEQASKMYSELSPETDQFFEFMRSSQLMDLENKDGKAPVGYATFIEKYNAPYIFSNFNGTSGDIDVLTHECGHAFQVYSSRHIKLDEYKWPTYEACEIHSMSMEFFAWPWMPLFFEKDSDKYKFNHLASNVAFLAYGVSIDEFQHIVYENPDATPAERNGFWKAIEKKYMPHCNYEDNAFLQQGGFWQRQSHLFNSPFYYIDYALAMICAMQYWKKDRKNHQEAWDAYLGLCKAGGSQSFLELTELGGVISPFEPGVVESLAKEVKDWLDQIDDSEF